MACMRQQLNMERRRKIRMDLSGDQERLYQVAVILKALETTCNSTSGEAQKRE